jgi:gamma-glutamylcyclotransferase (GGCT)/AIG2-like uncharacterized protein YtfP
MNCAFLFVYGTLRRNTHNKMSYLLAKRSEFIGEAYYQGKLYKLGDYPGVVPSDKRTGRVQGEVYRLRNPGLLLVRLDQYEECGLGFPEPTEYIRSIQRVRLQSGKTISAWVYLYNWHTDKLERALSGNFQSLNLFNGSKQISG